jgi:DNA invertase Pin-like site-specific DNA recombinase
VLLNVLGGVAEFEREIMLEQEREGVQKARAEGKYKGRKPTAWAKAEEIERLASEGLSMVRSGPTLDRGWKGCDADCSADQPDGSLV